MKVRPFLFLAPVLFFVAAFGPRTRGADDKVFEGEIADSQCATNVHSLTRSHKEMIDMGSAGKTPADCANYCVKSRGGKYVLQTKQNMYKLDSQDLAEKSAGRKVKVPATLAPKANVIQVHSIEPVPSK